MNKQERKHNRKARKIVRRKAVKNKFVSFFEFKFLRIKKALRVSRTRKTIKALAILVIALVPTLLAVAGMVLATTFTLTVGLFGAAVIALTLAVFAPKGFHAVAERYASRHDLLVEKTEALKWFTNMRTLKVNRKMAKKHSKYSKQGQKGRAKIAKSQEKAAAKARKEAEKTAAKKAILEDNTKFVGVTERPVETPNITINQR